MDWDWGPIPRLGGVWQIGRTSPERHGLALLNPPQTVCLRTPIHLCWWAVGAFAPVGFPRVRDRDGCGQCQATAHRGAAPSNHHPQTLFRCHEPFRPLSKGCCPPSGSPEPFAATPEPSAGGILPQPGGGRLPVGRRDRVPSGRQNGCCLPDTDGRFGAVVRGGKMDGGPAVRAYFFEVS